MFGPVSRNMCCVVCVCVCVCVYVQLLRNEVFAQDQVPLLMEMDSDSAALEKAIESGDPKLSMFSWM